MSFFGCFAQDYKNYDTCSPDTALKEAGAQTALPTVSTAG